MKVRTSRTILLWLAAVFLGVMLLLSLTGDAGARRELPAQIATWSFIGLLFFLGWWFKVRPRRELHRYQARSLSLRSAPGDPLGYFERPFALLGHAATAKDIENTSWGTWHGMEVVVIDCWFAKSSDPSRSDYRYYTCAATPVPTAWPNLSIVPEALGSRIATAMGGRDIDFELESFNRAFQVGRFTVRSRAGGCPDDRLAAGSPVGHGLRDPGRHAAMPHAATPRSRPDMGAGNDGNLPGSRATGHRVALRVHSLTFLP